MIWRCDTLGVQLLQCDRLPWKTAGPWMARQGAGMRRCLLAGRTVLLALTRDRLPLCVRMVCEVNYYRER